MFIKPNNNFFFFGGGTFFITPDSIDLKRTQFNVATLLLALFDWWCVLGHYCKEQNYFLGTISIIDELKLELGFTLLFLDVFCLQLPEMATEISFIFFVSLATSPLRSI